MRLFSLFELLIVTGMIAIFCALLLSSFVRVKQKATELKCQNNLRNIGSALLEYASDYYDCVPVYFPPWQNALLPYMGIKRDDYLEAGRPHLLFQCPLSPASASVNRFIKNNFGINFYQSNDAGTTSYPARQSIRSVHYPYRRMIVADRWEDSEKNQETQLNGKSKLAPRHGGGSQVNILYLDGRCKDEILVLLPGNRFVGSNLSLQAYFWGQGTIY